jgi:hypothetical protein
MGELFLLAPQSAQSGLARHEIRRDFETQLRVVALGHLNGLREKLVSAHAGFGSHANKSIAASPPSIEHVVFSEFNNSVGEVNECPSSSNHEAHGRYL